MESNSRHQFFDQTEIPPDIFAFFHRHGTETQNLFACNRLLKEVCGIRNFFASEAQLSQFTSQVEVQDHAPAQNRREYGDFQTNQRLADDAVRYLASKNETATCEFLLEPTCGKGSFILAALGQLPGLQKVTGIEIYQPYLWESKFNILSFFLQHPHMARPEIDILHANAFEFDFASLARDTLHLRTLVIGNPPWVTNAELGALASANLPPKSNFKHHRGLDALTGKGNFDLGESVTLNMLRHFSGHHGDFAFLVKNSVVKNILHAQNQNVFRIGGMEKLNIASKKEFGVSVDACLFHSRLNQEPEMTCRESDFYTGEERTVFGWEEDHFVHSISDYRSARDIEGTSAFTWRQGIKHDCSKVMEFERREGGYRNALGREFAVEEDLVYGLMKSADLKGEETNACRKFTLVTQRKIGQDTGYLRSDCPLTYAYLDAHRSHFDRRKSTIYRGKPDFSIFGVGDYSFKPYKVAISGMYRRTHFSLVLPLRDKPLMLDDTCYFIGFDSLPQARIARYLLNHRHTQQFIKSIIFPDAKRPITKDILMRLDFTRLCALIGIDEASREAGITPKDWEEFSKFIKG